MNERLVAMGDELVKLHDGFRRQLADLRDGRRTDLREHCLTFCDALHEHHTGEDAVLFPHLAGTDPELAEVLARLRSEHQVVARLLTRIRELLAGDAPVAAELDRLSRELEAHLDYEEEQLVPLLNKMTTFPEGL
ncbi:hemerythrin domain-containing protein [Nonomuraea rhizosphaerae]|uniref:hemerythrin domain-containing protein n=1 Tax=Nonomuraea rhizosphaerae TaxID=2665663 RepID=UPI0027E37539|nr:hemerythrin domain-containing protein [Nonomuraea rhizosphaerae]